MEQALEQALDRILGLNAEEKEQVNLFFTPQLLPAKKYWIEEGDRCNEIAFIETGYCRVFHF
ncbi:MAG: hypothetical protein R6U85_04485, partial [Salinivirgaceae bacterium]